VFEAKTAKKVALMAVLLLFAAAIAVCGRFALKHRDNLKAIYAAKTESTESIVEKAEKSKREQETLLRENDVQVAPPNLEQLESLINGTSTSDEVKAELGLDTKTGPAKPAGQETAPGDGETATALPEQPEPQEPPEPPEQRQARIRDLIDRCVKELYAYEVELMADLGVLKQMAIDEYTALPEEERTKEAKTKIGFKYLDVCYEMEVESDKQVKGILDRLRGDLESLDADTEIADTLWLHYCDEKSTAKEYYLNKYL